MEPALKERKRPKGASGSLPYQTEPPRSRPLPLTLIPDFDIVHGCPNAIIPLRANRLDRGRLRVGNKIALKVKRHVDQCNHHRHFYQGPDHSCECGSGVDAKY